MHAGTYPAGHSRRTLLPDLVRSLRPGIVEVIVDELGEVIAAKTILAVNTVYDRIALATARSWRYRPATLDGVPVKFRAIVQLQQKTR